MREELIFTILFYTAFCVFCLMSPLVPRVWRWPSPAGWLVMAVIGALGYTSLFSFEKALKRATLPALAPVLTTQPAWTAILAWILFKDKASIMMIGGIFWYSPLGATPIFIIKSISWIVRLHPPRPERMAEFAG